MESNIVSWTLYDLRPANVAIKHSLKLVDTGPIHKKSRRMSPRHNDIVRKELYKMLESGVIIPTVSPWEFPLVIVTKKDGKLRFCVDYRALNQKMKADCWPLPNIKENFDDMEGSLVFLTLYFFLDIGRYACQKRAKRRRILSVVLEPSFPKSSRLDS